MRRNPISSTKSGSWSRSAPRGLTDVEWLDEVGGELNVARKKFCEITDAVEWREVALLVIAHKDRLTR